MTTTATHETADAVAALKLVAAGRDDQVAATATGLGLSEVADLRAEHGPDRSALAQAAQTMADRVEAPIIQPDLAKNSPAATRQASAVPVADMVATVDETTPNDRQNDAPSATSALLERGRQSEKKRTQTLTAKIEAMLSDLSSRVDAEDQDKKRRQQEHERRQREKEQRDTQRREAQAEVERLETRLREAKAEARGGNSTQGNRTGQSEAARNRAAYHAAFMERHHTTAAEIRAWCAENDVACPSRAMIPRTVLDAYDAAHPGKARD